MANFKTTNCHTGEASFFSELQADASSYSCSWNTKYIPDTDVGSVPVYLQVLNKYNISTSSIDLPPGGTLPGMDINRMSALEAIKLSLAEALISGEWWEVVEDGEGGVFFQQIYKNGAPGKTIILNPRMCIPTTSKQNDVDMVIVTGYDRPPCRYAGEFRDVVPAGSGPVNPTVLPQGHFTIDEAEMLNSCHSSQLQNTTTKAYLDPLIDESVFQGQVGNPFFDPKAFESVSSWAIKVTGMPLANADAAKVNYSFSEQTPWARKIVENVKFTRVTNNSQAIFACENTVTDSSIVYYEAKFRINNQVFTDKYGDQWPLFIRPTNLLALGYKITKVHAFPTGNGNQQSYVFVDPVPQLLKMSEGTNWVYILDGDDFEFTAYYQPKYDPDEWDDILGVIDTGSGADVSIKVDDQFGYQTLSQAQTLSNATAAKTILGGTDGIGTYIMDMWMEFTIDRPSVVVTTKDKTPARPHSDALKVQYAPIVIFDPPAELAYKHKDFGVVQLDIDALALSEADSDPTTCQNFEGTPLSIMQDRSEGNVLNITLPFCQDAETCATVAETIFDYQNYGQVDTYALTCGPDDEPELGAAVQGYDSNLRIESISYSYSHGSSYTIEVNLGSVFSNTGSWGQGNFGGQYEQIDREGIVVWSGGDGVNYRVDVQGLGQYTAINSQQMIWRVGERVTVSLKNVPKVVV